MRLWHYKLIPYLPKAQLLGQHRECCALRGKGWGKKHSTVDYVFEQSYIKLFLYHQSVIYEMKSIREYKVNSLWESLHYRGEQIEEVDSALDLPNADLFFVDEAYEEHDEKYLDECIENLEYKYYQGKINEEEWKILLQGYDYVKEDQSCDDCKFKKRILNTKEAWTCLQEYQTYNYGTGCYKYQKKEN